MTEPAQSNYVVELYTLDWSFSVLYLYTPIFVLVYMHVLVQVHTYIVIHICGCFFHYQYFTIYY